MKYGWIFVLPVSALLLLGFHRCTPCNDCGPQENFPYITLRFFNMDSLAKVDTVLSALQDSLLVLNDSINQGNDQYIPVRDSLQNIATFFQTVQTNIKNGKIRINEVAGEGSNKILFFKDSLTHDSLTTFRFPMAMDKDGSEYLINIAGRIDTLQINYELKTETHGQSIIRLAYGISVTGTSYDSVKISCYHNLCLSNETTISVYF